MSEKKLHIIAFDIPVPVNYGGVIDIFYKLKYFKNAGIKIILHCFEYDRKPAAQLYDYCEKVYYYKRDISKTKLFHKLPYIVATRNAKDLITLLLKDYAPILFEGLHSTFFLNDKRIRNRLKIVRTHNIEHDYYKNLASIEKDMFKRYYFLNEASKLAKYEKVLEYADGIAAISKNDAAYLSQKYNHVQHISAFHAHDQVDCKSGSGKYCLYHGSLEIGENNEAALYLVKNIFNNCKIPFIIAGNKPSKELRTLVGNYSHIEIRTGISSEDIYDLIANAQINILPTFQSTGIKLKLLAALFHGRHCVVNSPMIINSGLENLCYCADTKEDMIGLIEKYFQKPFSENDFLLRKNELENSIFSNQNNIEKLNRMLYGTSN